MAYQKVLVSLLLVATLARIACAQGGPSNKRDPQALALLRGCVSSLPPSQRALNSYIASGTITYFWAGKQVSGSVTIKAQGLDQFYMESKLPMGTRRIAVNRGEGALIETDGSKTKIPYHNAINEAVPLVPQAIAEQMLPEGYSEITYIGQAGVNGRQTQRVQIHPTKVQPRGAGAIISRLLEKEIFIDAETNRIVRVSDKTHPLDGFSQEIDREFDYDNYTRIHDVDIPMLVREKIAGSTVFEIRVTTVSFSDAFPDADFMFN
jgi:hypothetical protein